MTEKMKVLEPGMDDTQAQADRHGWMTTIDHVTGKDRLAYFCDGAGGEVGCQFDADPMGEEYSAVTYGPETGGGVRSAGGPSGLQEQRTSDGRMTATAPQNYTPTSTKP